MGRGKWYKAREEGWKTENKEMKEGVWEKNRNLFKIYNYTAGKQKLKKKPHPNPTDSVAVSTICLQAAVFS